MRLELLPFFLAGDFNLLPSKLAETTLTAHLQAAILALEGLGTCRSAVGRWSTLDYAEVSRCLAWGVQDVQACASQAANPHMLVQVTVYASLQSRWTLAFPLTQRLSSRPVFGPMLPPLIFLKLCMPLEMQYL